MKMKIRTNLTLFMATLGALAIATTGCSRSQPEDSVGTNTESEDQHGGHNEGEEEHSEEASEVALQADQIKLAGITITTVKIGSINRELQLTGEVTLNQDFVTHVVPRVPGVVTEVLKTLGDEVSKGDLLAILDSRELADAKAGYLADRERLTLAQSNFKREEILWQKEISSEQEYLDARQLLAEARIELRSAEQKLHALGFSEEYLSNLPEQSDQTLTRFEITGPFDGTIIEKHITLGEKLSDEDSVYTIANMDTVWVIGSVYEKDIARVNIGQAATIFANAFPKDLFHGKIDWIGSTLEEETRTLKIRVQVENKTHRLKPGMFVRLAVEVEEKSGVLTVHSSSLLTQKGETILFVDKGNGLFERRDVETGIVSSSAIEIRKGVREGEKVVTDGVFILKSELGKEGFGEGHGH